MAGDCSIVENLPILAISSAAFDAQLHSAGGRRIVAPLDLRPLCRGSARTHEVDVLLRVFVGITLFAAAYLAEVVRGGLQAIPKGQVEAAASLGLSYWQTQRKIVLPQALKLVVPSIMNSFISTFKDTSLVTIVSLYDLTGSLALALGGDANWRQFYLEGYLFIAAIYWVGCFAMSRYSQWIEKQLNHSNR